MSSKSSGTPLKACEYFKINLDTDMVRVFYHTWYKFYLEISGSFADNSSVSGGKASDPAMGFAIKYHWGDAPRSLI